MPDIHITTVFKPGSSILVAHATPKAAAIIEMAEGAASRNGYPCIEIQYSLPQLQRIVRVFGEMRKTRTRPCIYRWRHADRQRLRVQFDCTRPSAATIDAVAGSQLSDVVHVLESSFASVRVTTDVLFSHGDDAAFDRAFARAKCGLVCITEAGQAIKSSAEAIAAFSFQELRRVAPHAAR